LFFDNRMYISRIVYQLLSRLDETNRFGLLKHSVEYGKSLYTIVDHVAIDGQEHGRFGNERPIPEPERQVTPEHLAELEQAALQRIRAASQDGSLQQTPNLDQVLHYWKNWSGDDSEARQFVEEVIDQDADLITIIEAFLTERRIQTVGDIAVRMEPRLDPSWLEPFLDPDKVIERVRRLLESADLTEKQQTALTQFVKEYDLRQQSKAPHDQ
jgi:predicted KAP-like P-loop ATPase